MLDWSNLMFFLFFLLLPKKKKAQILGGQLRKWLFNHPRSRCALSLMMAPYWRPRAIKTAWGRRGWGGGKAGVESVLSNSWTIINRRFTTSYGMQSELKLGLRARGDVCLCVRCYSVSSVPGLEVSPRVLCWGLWIYFVVLSHFIHYDCTCISIAWLGLLLNIKLDCMYATRYG